MIDIPSTTSIFDVFGKSRVNIVALHDIFPKELTRPATCFSAPPTSGKYDGITINTLNSESKDILLKLNFRENDSIGVAMTY